MVYVRGVVLIIRRLFFPSAKTFTGTSNKLAGPLSEFLLDELFTDVVDVFVLDALVVVDEEDVEDEAEDVLPE